jgi:hypothetical protein
LIRASGFIFSVTNKPPVLLLGNAVSKCRSAPFFGTTDGAECQS